MEANMPYMDPMGIIQWIHITCNRICLSLDLFQSCFQVVKQIMNILNQSFFIVLTSVGLFFFALKDMYLSTSKLAEKEQTLYSEGRSSIYFRVVEKSRPATYTVFNCFTT